MSIAITDDHNALASTVTDLLDKRSSRAAARALLEAADEQLPPFWAEMAELGWTGLHLPEQYGGSGYGLPELVVVVEQLGRGLATGPLVPSVVAGAVLAAAGDDATKARWLPGLAAGATTAGVGIGGSVTVSGGSAAGDAGTVLGAGLADLLLVPAGDDVVVVERGAGVTITVPRNLDPTRRSGRVTLDGAAAVVLPGARRLLIDLTRLVLAAEATGIARETTQQAAAYARDRIQFGRPIAMFQAVKHHCANMLVAAELATAAVWDASRADAGSDQLTLLAAIASVQAADAADLCANLNIQVHGGIGFTYEHDAHLYLRRATALGAFLDAHAAAAEVTDLTRAGVRRAGGIDLPPEAEPIREEVRAFIASLDGLDADARKDRLIDSGYAMPHWPRPWGRDAKAVEQLVIEQEFAAAGVKRPALGITGWVILTLIQHATEDQVARWVRPAVRQDVIWCQLFSEPDAGSDAAGIKAKATRVDGGWLINGQKVWTSGAHVAAFGFATVRTNPDAPKHQGITTVVIDMHGPGVEVRPLKQPSGGSDFNEVFFTDVFVPDDDVVGPIDGGWTVARATLGNESVSIGGGEGAMIMPGDLMITALDAAPDRLPGGSTRIGRYVAGTQAMAAMNLRSAHRAVAGGGPGPEGNVSKLLISEFGHEAAAIMNALSGPDAAFLDGPGAISGNMTLMHRALSIAGGTSEIKRNQIGERILGLPRDPLIS
jgi:alkylation response protein AidB-like acyl-CoA dehydrogenase